MGRRPAPPTIWRISAAGGAIGLVITIGGSYGLNWTWTGFTQNGSLWDWLHLLLLPIVLGALPLWIRTHRAESVPWRLALATVFTALVVLVIGGYGLDWTWTGFAGNRLWDWLHLLILPVVVGLSPLWFGRDQRARLGRRRRLALGALGAGLGLALVGGYGLGWTWTGFAGNRLWDWLDLLLVPVVIPLAFGWLAVQIGEERAAAAAAPADTAPVRPDQGPAEQEPRPEPQAATPPG